MLPAGVQRRMVAMNAVHTQGIVLKYTNTNESDRMLTVFSPSLGKISVLARGCRKPKSKFLSAAAQFSYSDLVLLTYRDLYILSQAEVINLFYDLRRDPDRLAYANYLAELAEEAANAGEENSLLFALLLKALSYLSYGENHPADVTAAFELKYLDICGFRPELDRCIRCLDALSGRLAFDVHLGGVLCGPCGGGAAPYPVSGNTLQAMEQILAKDIGMAVSPHPEQTRAELEEILPEFISVKLDKRFRGRDYLDVLLGLGKKQNLRHPT